MAPAPSPSPSPGPLTQPQITLPSKSTPNGTHRISRNTLSPSPKTIKSSKRAISPAISTNLRSTDWEDDWVEAKPMTITSNTLSPVPSATPITKEEKAAELARRKEERKQVGLSTGFLCESSDSFPSVSLISAYCDAKRTEEKCGKGFVGRAKRIIESVICYETFFLLIRLSTVHEILNPSPPNFTGF